MSRTESLRQDLAGVGRFLRRMNDDEHNDPHLVPPLPPARLVGIRNRGEMFVREAPGADGPTVVLLHGWGLSADLNWFSGVYDVATSHGPMLAPDLRGHGRGLRGGKALTLELMAEDVAALIEELDAAPVVAVGYSLGGSLSLLLWKHHRSLVAGMVLISTALRWRSSLRERLVWSSMAAVEYGLRLGATEGGMADRYLRMAVEESEELRRYKSWVKAEMRRGDASDIAAAGRGLSVFDARHLAPQVDVPITVVVTAEDRLIRAARQRELASALPGAEVIEVDGAHNAWLVRPAAFNEAVDEALSRVVSACGKEPGGTRPDR